MDGNEQLAALKQQLLEALIARSDADDKIKAIRNMIAGIPIGQALAQPREAEAPPEE